MSLALRVKDLHREVIERQSIKSRIDLEKLDNYCFKINYTDNSSRMYKPVRTGLLFHSDRDSSVKSIKGPYGSGKTTVSLFEIISLAQDMPKCKDGIRRAKVAVIRQTYNELVSTTLASWEMWFERFGHLSHITKHPYPRATHHFKDEFGEIHLDVIFLALDNPKHFKKLKSLEITFAYLNESSEQDVSIYNHLLGRVGRYPMREFIDDSSVKRWYERKVNSKDELIVHKSPYWAGVISDTNPPSQDSAHHKLFEITKPIGFKIYSQPPGMFKNDAGKWVVNVNAENIERLGLDYYEKQASGATEEYIRVFCCGEYGSINIGKLVYVDYNDDLHSANNVEIDKKSNLIIGIDGGFTPSAIICQVVCGQIRVLHEITTKDVGMDTFCNDILVPLLNEKFDGIKIGVVSPDPACSAGEKVSGAVSDLAIIRKAFSSSVVIVPKSNQIKPRLNAVTRFLTRFSMGKPLFLLDRDNCAVTRRGFLKDYRYKKIASNVEAYEDKPEKNEASHPHDALQYSCLAAVGNYLLETNNFKKYQEYVPRGAFA